MERDADEIIPIGETVAAEEAKERHSGCDRQLTQIILRLLAVGSMGVAWAIMFFSEETQHIAGRVTYGVSPAFMFFVYATGVVCLYCMATIPFAFYFYKNRFLFALDMTMMALAMACASAVTAIGYVAELGNSTMMWSSACSFYKSYCNRAIVSVAFSYLGFFSLFILCIISALSSSSTTTPPARSSHE